MQELIHNALLDHGVTKTITVENFFQQEMFAQEKMPARLAMVVSKLKMILTSDARNFIRFRMVTFLRFCHLKTQLITLSKEKIRLTIEKECSVLIETL